MTKYSTSTQPSEIRDLQKRVADRKYDHYLLSMDIPRLRGLENQRVSFDFPVTAIIGPNGGGKSTVLGAAGLIYTGAPRDFFAKSGRYDESMKDWRIEYAIHTGGKGGRQVTRTASYLKSKWNRERMSDRTLVTFGVARTVPASERKEFARALGNNYSAPSEVPFDATVASAAASVLDKSFEKFQTNVDRDLHLFSGETEQGDRYSQFHFGAGEASVLQMIGTIEGAPNNSLVLIEEIENGLHPLATLRLVDYLIGAARRKSLQVIFTTHSNDALLPLPESAVWACVNKELQQGKLDVDALRAIEGRVTSQLAIYVEDEMAAQMVSAAVRAKSFDALGSIEVHPLKGHGNVTKVQRARRIDPATEKMTIAFLDGDLRQSLALGKDDDDIFFLPGTLAPEAHVLSTVCNSLDTMTAKLCYGMGIGSDRQALLKETVESVMRTANDDHSVFELIGTNCGLVGESAVRQAFLTCWIELAPDEAEEISNTVLDALTAAESDRR